MIVVDASVLVVALADDGAAGRRLRARLRGQRLVAPALIDLEVLSVLRRQVRAGAVTGARAEAALRHLADLPMARPGHAPLLARCWELRGNLTAYDAAYVALAELLGCPLLTADRRLAQAPGPRCPIDLVT